MASSAKSLLANATALRVVNGDVMATKPRLTASICIPTYRRPAYMRCAVQSVLRQTRRADEIIVISRRDDDPTNVALAELMQQNPGLIRNSHVVEPGFLPPVKQAVKEASCDVIVLLDDDAEAHPDWLERIMAHYGDASVGGVGGRCVDFQRGVLQIYPPTSTFGQLSWFGRSVGNMYRDATFEHAVDVDHLMGGNMSYRADLFRRCLPDPRIGNNVAFYWEMDVAQQVKRAGWRILYDPAIRIDHHTAPREVDGMRTVNAEAIYWSNHNYALLMRKHLSAARLAAFALYTSLVGSSSAPGLVYLAVSTLRGQPLSWRLQVKPSILGRWRGFRA